MKRRWKVLIAVAVGLIALLAVNTVVVDSETRGAEITAEGGELVDVSAVDLQVVDSPATGGRRAGRGAPIVLLHGYATSLHWFERLMPLLNRRHRVISIDLIGHGGSQKPKSGYTIEEQARAVAEALSGLGVEGATVVGHSMGGYVAIELAALASQLVDRVAVLGTPAADEGELPLIARLTYAPVLGQALWRLRFDSLIESGYEQAFAPGFDIESGFIDPDQVVEDNEAMTFSSYDDAAARADEFIAAESMPSRLTRTAVPFLAILGAEDEIVDSARAAEGYEAVPGAAIRVLEGIGHSPHVEDPETTAAMLLRFAEAGSSPGSRPRPPGRGR